MRLAVLTSCSKSLVWRTTATPRCRHAHQVLKRQQEQLVVVRAQGDPVGSSNATAAAAAADDDEELAVDQLRALRRRSKADKQRKQQEQQQQPTTGAGVGMGDKQRRSGSGAGPTVIAPLRDQVYGGGPLTEEQKAEGAVVSLLALVFAAILVEGVFLAASGFMGDGADRFAQDIVYPAFSPTLGLFLAISTAYGVWKTRSGGPEQ